jgi:hypothetical protein
MNIIEQLSHILNLGSWFDRFTNSQCVIYNYYQFRKINILNAQPHFLIPLMPIKSNLKFNSLIYSTKFKNYVSVARRDLNNSYIIME